MAPSRVNDAARALQGAITRDWNWRGPTVTSSGTNTVTLTYSVAPAAYYQGMVFCFIAGGTNTGATTLNVNSLGAKSIFVANTACVGGEILSGNVYVVAYDGTQFQMISPATSVSSGYSVTKNTLINGDLEIWQRGAGGAASISVAASTTAYTADRWYITTGANEACTIAQQAGLTNGSRFCARVQRNSGQTGTTAIVFGQPLTTDMVVPLRGQTVTISARVRSGANWSPTSGNLTMTFYVGTGTEGKRGAGFTGETSVATVTSALSTSSAVTLMSATSGSAVPTNATQGALLFSFTPVGTAGASDYVEIDEVQIEVSSAPTLFDRREFGLELTRCQRFYWKSFQYGTAPAQNIGTGTGEVNGVAGRAGAATSFLFPNTFPVVMRGTPAMTYFNTSAANAQVRDLSVPGDCSGTVSGQATARVFSVNTTGNASTAVGNALAVHATADADL